MTPVALPRCHTRLYSVELVYIGLVRCHLFYPLGRDKSWHIFGATTSSMACSLDGHTMIQGYKNQVILININY